LRGDSRPYSGRAKLASPSGFVNCPEHQFCGVGKGLRSIAPFDSRGGCRHVAPSESGPFGLSSAAPGRNTVYYGVAMVPSSPPTLRSTLRGWWRDGLARDGFKQTARNFANHLWEFLRESTPAQRRQRYGDADYDWDYHVNTTSATVGWHDRLLGEFHSAYQPTEPALFRQMMETMLSRGIDFQAFTFIDVGSGKGRALLMAANYPFRSVLGLELFPALHRVAQANIRAYKSESQRCFAVESVAADAREFVFPDGPLVVYLFNPLPEAALIRMMANLERSLHENPQTVYVLYHNPLLEHVLAGCSGFQKIMGGHQYSVFRTRG
jgi:SAM-dependent methyltransferase